MFVLEPKAFAECDLTTVLRFVRYWERFYPGDDNLYIDALNPNTDLTHDNLIALLRWKDPRMLTHPRKSDGKPNPRVERVLSNSPSINRFRHGQLSADDFGQVTTTIFPNGIIWQLFLFHIACPSDWPIADQHVFRAYSKLSDEPEPTSIPDFQRYIAFFNKLVDQFFSCSETEAKTTSAVVAEKKRIDNALFAYGQFLATYDC